MTSAVERQLRAEVEPLLSAADLDCEGLTVNRAGKRRVVRILVDADHDVTLDDIAEISRKVSACLDNSELMGQEPYTLEVGTPGVERPLNTVKHWRRNIGRLVRVRRAVDTANTQDSPVVGRIQSVSSAGVVLEIEEKRSVRQEELSYDEIASAVVQVELNK